MSLASLEAPLASVDAKIPAVAPAAPAASDPWIGRVVGGRFKLLERIGAGGMAVVYRAQEQGLIRRDVAIKLLTPESALSQATLARFLKEAQVIADIHHPNVVQVIDVGRTDDGHLYLVMELLVGHTLHQELQQVARRGEVFTWERASSIALQICAALQAAHKHKVVHRDIKPSNCFCIEVDDTRDFIKLLDFGIAKAQGGGGSAEDLTTPLTQEGMFLGTPHYAAPEVITQDPNWPIDGRADIFAVGVMLYQMLTGTLPFQGENKLDVLYKTVRERPPPPRIRAPEYQIPVEVDALVMKAMATDPHQRFPTVAALIEAIRATLPAFRPPTLVPDTGRSGGVLVTGSIVELGAPSTAYDHEATVPRQQPPKRVSVVLQPRDGGDGTPPPPGEPTIKQPVQSPTLAEQAAPSSGATRGEFALAVLMLVGLIGLLGLLIHEFTGEAPATRPAPVRKR